jgi:hypothetical protein
VPSKSEVPDALIVSGDARIQKLLTHKDAIVISAFACRLDGFVDPSPFQVRKFFHEDNQRELAESIKREGLIEPIVVRRKWRRYEIIAGERRFRALRDHTEMKTIPALMRRLLTGYAVSYNRRHKRHGQLFQNMLNWHHSGFNVYCGNAIWPHKEEGLENLARYIIRASFSQERMTYIPANDSSDGAKVVYESKDGKTSKTFDALDWLAQLVTHIPNRGEQMVRYYGFYSNKS